MEDGRFSVDDCFTELVKDAVKAVKNAQRDAARNRVSLQDFPRYKEARHMPFDSCRVPIMELLKFSNQETMMSSNYWSSLGRMSAAQKQEADRAGNYNPDERLFDAQADAGSPGATPAM